MTYCLNLTCPHPENPDNVRFCLRCGCRVWLGDRIRPLKPISEQGIGRTFLAVDEADANKGRCVVKQLSLKGEESQERLEQEVLRLQRLGEHPQIPAFIAYFEAGENPMDAIAQEYIEGKSLTQIAATETQYDETQIRHLLNEILPVLHCVHDSGVIHRDINPNNIIRRQSDRQLMLVDFSAAKLTRKTALAKTGTVIGSAAYTAPEQLRGKAVFSSDLYSLGVTCIYLLTLMHPFELFSTYEGIFAWQDYLAEPISDRLCSVLNKMVMQSLKKRYSSAKEVLADLNPDLPLSLPTLHPNTEAVTVTAVIPTWHCIRTLKGHSSSIHSLAFSPQGELLISGSADRCVKLWNLESPTPQQTFSGHRSIIDTVIFTPNGKTILSGSWDYTIKQWDLETGEIQQTFNGHSGWIHSLVISPNGQLLASGSADKTIKLWDINKGIVMTTLLDHCDAIQSLAFSPNGQLLASGSADKTIKLWDVSRGKAIARFSQHHAAVQSVCFSPSGQLLISGSADTTIRLWNLSTHAYLRTLTGHSDTIHGVAINAEGNCLASVSADSTLKLWHPASGKVIDTLSSSKAGLLSVAIAPNNSLIATGSQDKTIHLWQFG